MLLMMLRHSSEYFVKYRKKMEKPTDGLKYGEHQLGNIWSHV